LNSSWKDPLNRITSYFYDDPDRQTKVVGAEQVWRLSQDPG
jgi:hypothetical protein